MALCSTNNDSLHIDLNVTSICNYACLYCSEAAEPDNAKGGCDLATLYLKNTQVKVEDLINRLNKEPSKSKTINFWGGEPFINWDYCKAVIDGFKDDETFSFFFYTHGGYISEYIDEIKAYNNEFGRKRGRDGRPRLVIQVSYDGKYLSNNIRVDKSGNGTTERTLEGYNLLKEAGVETSLKAVISNDGFAHLFDTYVEMVEHQGFYGPTPDMWSDGITDEQFEVLGEQLMKIASYQTANNLNPDTFTWFSKSRAMCSVGLNMTSIDLNGDVHPCHGAMYGESKEHILGHIDDFSDVILKSKAKFKPLFEFKPLECQNCEVNFCMKCEVANYAKSNLPSYEQKWTDYQANSTCKLFKFVDQYNRAARYLSQESK